MFDKRNWNFHIAIDLHSLGKWLIIVGNNAYHVFAFRKRRHDSFLSCRRHAVSLAGFRRSQADGHPFGQCVVVCRNAECGFHVIAVGYCKLRFRRVAFRFAIQRFHAKRIVAGRKIFQYIIIILRFADLFTVFVNLKPLVRVCRRHYRSPTRFRASHRLCIIVGLSHIEIVDHQHKRICLPIPNHCLTDITNRNFHRLTGIFGKIVGFRYPIFFSAANHHTGRCLVIARRYENKVVGRRIEFRSDSHLESFIPLVGRFCHEPQNIVRPHFDGGRNQPIVVGNACLRADKAHILITAVSAKHRIFVVPRRCHAGKRVDDLRILEFALVLVSSTQHCCLRAVVVDACPIAKLYCKSFVGFKIIEKCRIFAIPRKSHVVASGHDVVLHFRFQRERIAHGFLQRDVERHVGSHRESFLISDKSGPLYANAMIAAIHIHRTFAFGIKHGFARRIRHSIVVANHLF